MLDVEIHNVKNFVQQIETLFVIHCCYIVDIIASVSLDTLEKAQLLDVFEWKTAQKHLLMRT